jgi:hypothetical protein
MCLGSALFCRAEECQAVYAKKNCTKQQIKLVSSAPDVLYVRYAQKVSRFCIQGFGFLFFLVHIQEEYVNT